MIPLKWKGRSLEGIQPPPFFLLFSTFSFFFFFLKKASPVLRTSRLTLACVFICVCLPSLLCSRLSLSGPFESYVDITQCEALSLKRRGHRVQVHRDSCPITPQTLRPQTSYIWDIIVPNTDWPSRLAMTLPAAACLRWGGSVFPFDAGLNSV